MAFGHAEHTACQPLRRLGRINNVDDTRESRRSRSHATMAAPCYDGPSWDSDGWRNLVAGIGPLRPVATSHTDGDLWRERTKFDGRKSLNTGCRGACGHAAARNMCKRGSAHSFSVWDQNLKHVEPEQKYDQKGQTQVGLRHSTSPRLQGERTPASHQQRRAWTVVPRSPVDRSTADKSRGARHNDEHTKL